MKIKVVEKPYDEVVAIPKPARKKPVRPSLFFRTLLRLLSKSELAKTKFDYTTHGMEKLGKKEPCIILMNHSSFIDLKIAATVFADRRFNIVCTSDGFVGKEGLMRRLGCIPARKFITDVALLKDMKYAVDKLKDSILMYPEASYSFDGTATPLPDSVGKAIKMLDVPVIMVKTTGAFHRSPLYNDLKLRKVKVSADVTYLLSAEDIRSKSVDEINELLKEQFTFDNWAWQQENEIKIKEKNRADHLNRVLYLCPHCMAEGKLLGKGTKLTCVNCEKEYELTEDGYMKAADGYTEYEHIPKWYAWERECVKREITSGYYELKIPVKILMMVDYDAVYSVGTGELVHNSQGFTLTGCDGKLNYHQNPQATYSLYADYFWYEIGDMICIGDSNVLYYCFPTIPGDYVAKTRLAAEEMFKLRQEKI